MPERLRDLEAEVRDLPVMPAAAVRARGRSRGRRRLAAWTAAGAVVAVTGFAYAWPHLTTAATGTGIGGSTGMGTGGSTGTGAGTAPATRLPATALAVACDLALPGDPADVHIRVVGGGAPAATLQKTATQLRDRRFRVESGPDGSSGPNGPDDPNGPTGSTGPDVAEAATLHYGPASIGAATLVRAEVTGAVTMLFDADRGDDTIDLTVGAAFTRLATTTEVNQSLVAAGEPTAPPQCHGETGVTPR
ncbi:hypothetical protein ACQP2F_05500 [Actinoplanes sp. CA-030573]|uniref:hypothetical protein n=1 Tax=Actinoplanes sp. CA-030573 TaxID=3239898 RepID=UPI003D92CA90